MNPVTTAALAVLSLAAAGCTMTSPEDTGTAPVPVPPGEAAPAPDNPPGDSCGAAAFQEYVGQKSPQISVPAGTAVRHYRTGDPVTMDLRAERMNFEYDRAGKLLKVSCG